MTTKEGAIVVFVDHMDDIVNFEFLESYGGYVVYEVPRDNFSTWNSLADRLERSGTTVMLMTRNVQFIWFLASAIEKKKSGGLECPGNVFFVNINRVVNVNGLGDISVKNEYEVRSLDIDDIQNTLQ